MPNNDDGNHIVDDLDLDWSALFPQMHTILGEVATTSAGQLFANLEYTPSDDVFAEVAESTANYAALRAAELVGKKWINGELVDNPNAAWSIGETTRNALYSLVNQALEEGWSSSKIGRSCSCPIELSRRNGACFRRLDPNARLNGRARTRSLPRTKVRRGIRSFSCPGFDDRPTRGIFPDRSVHNNSFFTPCVT